MGDVGEIKGRVSFEYDGGGIDKAKSDAQSLAEIAGGSLAEGANKASESLQGLDEQAGKSSGSIGTLAENAGSLEKPFSNAVESISSVSEELGSNQAMIESTGKAYEAIQKPIGETAVMLESVSEPMMAISKSAESMQAQISSAGDGFVQVQESLSQAVPLLPQYAEGLQSVSEQLAPQSVVMQHAADNMSAFQDAMENPSPFSMIQQHLADTGQTWDDFTSSIGDSNVAVLHDMATNADVTHSVMGGISKDVQSVGQVFAESATATDEFTQAYNGLGKTIAEPTGGGGGGLFESFGQGSAGGIFGGIMEGLNKVAMPIMAVQMIGMAIGGISTGIYNMAAAAEGPAAHGVGTFTGAIDQLGQHAQDVGKTFSESFGKGMLPSLDAMNNAMATSNESDFWSHLGSGLGTVVGVLGDATQILGGSLVGGLVKTITLNPSNESGNSWVTAGWEGLQNTWADITGGQEPYPGPDYAAQAPNVNMPQIQQSLAQNTAMMTAQANNPQYLAAQTYLQSQTAYAQLGQASYNDSHITGMSVFDYTPQQYQRSMMSQVAAMPYATQGISSTDINRAFFNSMDTSNAAASYPGVVATWAGQGGCFPAGTQVLMAESSATKPIETLRIGECVLAYDGTKHVPATVLATIIYHSKCIYTLAFSDGNTLPLTDSHPVMTDQGWKSLSPSSTALENPGLPVTTLQIGDTIHTIGGTCTLEEVTRSGIADVYNITVDGEHTFYAENILVHNGKGSAIMQNIADASIPQMSLKGSNLIDSLASNFSSASMEHTFTATVNWAATGLTQNYVAQAAWSAVGLAKDFLAQAAWSAEGLAKDFLAQASWAAQGLEKNLMAVASWAAQGLEKSFIGQAVWQAVGLTKDFLAQAAWAAQGLEHAFEGVVSWVASGGLQHTFQGVTDWIGQNLEHTFTGIASWIGQNLNATFSTGGSTPGFASGVQGFAGGWATVGEQGPELLYLPQGSNVYPQSGNGFKGLDMSSMGNNGDMITVNVTHLINLDSRVIAQQTIPHIAPLSRLATGRRAG